MKRETLLTSIRALGLILGVWTLGGCVFVVNPDGEDGVSARWASSYDSDEGEYTVGKSANSANASLARQVGQAIETDPDLAKRKIQVTVSNADVTLHGNVNSIDEFDRAVTIALGVDGVDEVISRMTVRVERKQSVSASAASE